MNLRKIEILFNEQCDTNKIIKNATKYVEKRLWESNNDFLFKKVKNDSIKFNKLKIEYKIIELILNQVDGMQPFFLIKFDLYEPNEDFADYFYEIKYDYLGQFLGEDFGELYPNTIE